MLKSKCLNFYHMPAKKKIHEEVVATNDPDDYELTRVKDIKDWTENVTSAEEEIMPQELWDLEVTGLLYIKDGKKYFFDVDSCKSTPLSGANFAS